jgi:hypothetical protein
VSVTEFITTPAAVLATGKDELEDAFLSEFTPEPSEADPTPEPTQTVEVTTFKGTTYQQLFEFIPELTLPAAVLMLSEVAFQNRPRAGFQVRVLCCCDGADPDAGLVSAWELGWIAIGALDDLIEDDQRWRCSRAEAVDFGPESALAVVMLTFSVEDH